MYHKIRITVVSLAVMAICALSSSATLSYFTDTDASSNSFTIGNASTALAIYDDEAGGSGHVFDASNYVLTDNLDIPFYLQATNDGNIPVYQRFRVVIPKALASVVTLSVPIDGCTIVSTVESTCSNANYTITYKPSVNDIYAEYYIISNSAIDVNESTEEWPTTEIKIGNISGVDNSLFACANNNNDCVLGISAYSDVIQTTGFTNAIDAFANFTETYN